ncbi:MAG: XTP/dITP diphosphohydrolase, partial [Arcobacteraceae bacterium]
THGWMYGDVINEEKGEGGFGYDPLFIPEGYQNNLGILKNDVKKELSHRSKALKLAMKVIEIIKK